MFSVESSGVTVVTRSSGVALISVVPLIALLLVVAIGLTATVLIASRHSLVIWQKFKAAMAVLVWVVPASLLVFVIALRPVRQFHSSPAVETATAVTTPISDSNSGRVVQQATMVANDNAAAHSMPVAVEASAPRLLVRGISSDDPRWESESKIINGRELICLSSQRFATIGEAEEQMTQQVLARIQSRYGNEFPIDASSAKLLKLIDIFAVKDYVGEVIDKYDFGNGITGKMYRTHLRLDFTPQFHDAIAAQWRVSKVHHRVAIFGGILGLVTLMLGTAASYFRLDDATGGLYRKRLKLAAAAVIAAGGLAATAFVS
jgi:hypothetical protein